MEIDILESLPTRPEALRLMDELSDRLAAITGDSGRARFTPEAWTPEGSCFLLAMHGGEAVGCAALRPLALGPGMQACEIKRMYARQPGRGIGSALLRALEQHARGFGYRTACLETRKINQHAVDFYIRYGYRIRENFGPYVGRTEAVCFEKHLQF